MIRCFLLVQLFIRFPAFGQTLTPPTYSPDARVHTLLSMGDTIILGGDFRHLGVYTGGGAAFPLGSNTPNLGFPKFIGSISASCPDGQGGVYVAGRFAKEAEPSNNPTNRIEHVRADGSFNPDFSLMLSTNSSGIQSLVLHQGILYIGGRGIVAIAQQPAGNLAGIRISDRQLVATLPALASNAEVNRLRVIGNSLYVMGRFTTMGMEARANLAAIDLQNGSVKAWNPSAALPIGSQQIFNDLQPYGNSIILGGNFGTGGLPRNHALAVVDTLFGSQLQYLFSSDALFGSISSSLYWAAGVLSVAIDGTSCYAFSSGTFDTRVTCLSLSSGQIIWTKYFNTNAQASDMFLHNGSLYIGGENFEKLYRTNLPNVDTAFERNIKGLVRLNSNTGDYQPWTADPVGPITRDVSTMCRTGNQVFAGGTFSHVNGVERTGIAMIRVSSHEVLSFAPPPFDFHTVRSLKAVGNVLYAGGSFPFIDGEPFDKAVVSFNFLTGELLPFNVSNWGTGTVQTLEADQESLYVGGNFSESGGGNGRQHLIAVNRQTGAIESWSPNPNFQVTSLHRSGDKLFAGGHFSTIAGQLRSRVAAFSLPTLLLDSFRTAPNSNIQA